MKKPLIALALAISALTAHAADIPPPTLQARSWVLLDSTTGKVLGEVGADTKADPASLTKVMTAYVTFKAINEKRVTLDQMVNVSHAAWKVDADSSKMFIDPKVPVKVNDLLYGLIVQSGNDAAVALAEAVAGSVETFAVLMNREAQRLGMKNTNFVNPHGLSHKDHYSSARDLAILAKAMTTDFPELYKIYSTRSYTYNNITQQNRNVLLTLDPTVDGMKTGYTKEAGYCLISTAKRKTPTGVERRLISVVLGEPSVKVRTQESMSLLNWGFMNTELVKPISKGQVVATTKVWKGETEAVKIGFNQDALLSVAPGDGVKIKQVFEKPESLTAPLAANTKVGVVKLMLNDKVIKEYPIVTLEEAKEGGFFSRGWDSVKMMF